MDHSETVTLTKKTSETVSTKVVTASNCTSMTSSDTSMTSTNTTVNTTTTTSTAITISSTTATSTGSIPAPTTSTTSTVRTTISITREEKRGDKNDELLPGELECMRKLSQDDRLALDHDKQLHLFFQSLETKEDLQLSANSEVLEMTNERLKNKLANEESEPTPRRKITFVITDRALYEFPPVINVDGKQFLILNQCKRHRLEDIKLVSLPFRTHASAEQDYALRADDFVVHFRSDKLLWIDTHEGNRSPTVEMLSDAFMAFTKKNLELNYVDEIELIQALVDGTLDQFLPRDDIPIRSQSIVPKKKPKRDWFHLHKTENDQRDRSRERKMERGGRAKAKSHVARSSASNGAQRDMSIGRKAHYALKMLGNRPSLSIAGRSHSKSRSRSPMRRGKNAPDLAVAPASAMDTSQSLKKFITGSEVRVKRNEGDIFSRGIIRWKGEGKFATGVWLGIELLEKTGKNDGAVAETRYFTCKPGYGLFAKPRNVTLVEELAKIVSEFPATEAPVTGAAATQAPATEAPAIGGIVSDAPATEAPATEAPATEAPATEAPAEEISSIVTEAPAQDSIPSTAPATEAPATEVPVETDL